MAIKKSFGGASILKPGVYSLTKVDNTAGSSLESNDTLFLVGESTKGAPGDVEGITVFRAAQLSSLIAKYGSGPIVDCALAATRPSKTPGVNGAGRFMIWKTNSSTQASRTLLEATATNPLFVVKDRAWGVEGNNLSITIANGTTSLQKLITINKLNDTVESLGENAAQQVTTIDYTGNATTAALVISGVSEAAKTLTTTLAGDQTDGSVNLSISLSSYNIKELVDFINAQVGYLATLVTTTLAAKKAVELDSIASTSILSPLTLYRLQYEILEIINSDSNRVEATLATTPVIGLPVNVTNVFLTGGALGASVNSDFSNGFSASLAEDWNVVIPCISQNATSDITLGVTDAGSTYTIASVLAAASSHLAVRGSIKNRKEAQGMGGFRSTTKSAAYNQAGTMGDFQFQLAIQDVQIIDALGNSVWKQPHVKAALDAGIRLGTPVGEPLTHKFLNVLNVGHAVNPVTGVPLGDFNPNLDVEEAIEAGILFVEKVGGGWRVVVDNTTYAIDSSFVYNRGSVVEAAQFVAKTIRKEVEANFVGKKVSNGQASSIKTFVRSILISLNAPEVNIITASDDAPQGFREDTFVVTQSGNTTNIQIHIKPVQGQDFVFIDITAGDISQAA